VHQVAQLTGVDEGDLKSRAHAAKPDAFVEVVTLRDTDYQAQKAKLQPIPGTVFRAGQLPLAPTRGFASALLGRAGPVTAEIVDKSAGRYVAGDTAGLSGLQQQYDTQLSGTPGVAVRIVASDGTVEKTFDIVDAKNGSNIATTIDPRVQSAAETAISGVDKQTSLVAVNVRTRDVLAVANGPDVGGLDRALTGQYPPGSSFKVVSAYALESAGLKSTDTVSCPPSVTVDGRVFANAEKESFGDIPFHTDFARSCNTAFVNASSRLGKSSLAEAAASFGVGTPWSMGVPVFPGSVPQSDDKVERSADVIGQGKVLVSPLAMANVSAVAASGTNQAPRLVTDPAPSGSNPIGTNLDPALVASLQSMMREVVTEGTGTAAARVPGAPVFGKTGTAEFGTDNPPRTHAWFVGYQNDVAFAVLVEDGGFGGDVAAPIAAKFLTALGS
jgi:cell division protein FtsI/penicillin-binding protein 2